MASRTARVRGKRPPGYDEGWEISTVAERVTTRDGTATCAVTGDDVPLDDPHYFVKLKRESKWRFQPPEYDDLVIVDDLALEELEEQLEGDDKY